MELKWKNPTVDGYPKLQHQCFIEIEGGFFELAFWNNKNKIWINYFGTMPKTYDDSGGVYEPQVIRWAYTPDELYEKTNLSICKCYRPKMYQDGYDRCIGTKEIDICSCDGDKRKCDFYD